MFIDSYKLLLIYNLIYYTSSILMFKESKWDNNKAREAFKLKDREKERERVKGERENERDKEREKQRERKKEGER